MPYAANGKNVYAVYIPPRVRTYTNISRNVDKVYTQLPTNAI